MYYHYTNRHGAMAIIQSGYLQPSEQSGAFGPGVYLTDLNPFDFFRTEILANNYGGIQSRFHNRADWVVEVLEKNLNLEILVKVNVPGKPDRRIYVYPYIIFVNPAQIYDKPRCLKGYVDYQDSDESGDDTNSDGLDEVEEEDQGSNCENGDESSEDNEFSEEEADESGQDFGSSGEEEDFECESTENDSCVSGIDEYEESDNGEGYTSYEGDSESSEDGDEYYEGDGYYEDDDIHYESGDDSYET